MVAPDLGADVESHDTSPLSHFTAVWVHCFELMFVKKAVD